MSEFTAWVGNIPDASAWRGVDGVRNELRTLFEAFGAVAEVTVRLNQVGRGGSDSRPSWGLVTYGQHEAAALPMAATANLVMDGQALGANLPAILILILVLYVLIAAAVEKGIRRGRADTPTFPPMPISPGAGSVITARHQPIQKQLTASANTLVPGSGVVGGAGRATRGRPVSKRPTRKSRLVEI